VSRRWLLYTAYTSFREQNDLLTKKYHKKSKLSKNIKCRPRLIEEWEIQVCAHLSRLNWNVLWLIRSSMNFKRRIEREKKQKRIHSNQSTFGYYSHAIGLWSELFIKFPFDNWNNPWAWKVLIKKVTKSSSTLPYRVQSAEKFRWKCWISFTNRLWAAWIANSVIDPVWSEYQTFYTLMSLESLNSLMVNQLNHENHPWPVASITRSAGRWRDGVEWRWI